MKKYAKHPFLGQYVVVTVLYIFDSTSNRGSIFQDLQKTPAILVSLPGLPLLMFKTLRVRGDIY